MIKVECRAAMPDVRKLTNVSALAQRTLCDVFSLVIASGRHTYSRLPECVLPLHVGAQATGPQETVRDTVVTQIGWCHAPSPRPINCYRPSKVAE